MSPEMITAIGNTLACEGEEEIVQAPEEAPTEVIEDPDRPKTYCTITLEKVRKGKGPAPIGEIFTYTYKSLTRDQALQRASKMLEFQGKENRLDWKELR